MTALRPLAAFIMMMWALMIIGGGVLVTLVAPIEIDCCGEHNLLASSAVKAVVTFGLVILWILILSYMKKAILHRMLR